MKTSEEIAKMSKTELKEEIAAEKKYQSELHPTNTTPLDKGNYPNDFEVKFDSEREDYLDQLTVELKKRS